MKLLIAIKSCHRDRDRGCHQAIRDTWGSKVVTDVTLGFFIGRDENSGQASWRLGDETQVDAPDDYENLPLKTREILRQSIGWNYDFTFLCDNDTFVNPERLLQTGFEKFDYSGRFGVLPPVGTQFDYTDGRGIEYPGCHPWASGGVGYFLSKKAAEHIVQFEPNIWAEDMWVGQVLGPEIQAGRINAANLSTLECQAAWHFARTRRYRFYTPEMMYRSFELGDPGVMYEQDRKSR